MLVHVVNLSISSGLFSDALKTAIVKLLLKKPTLDPECLKNYWPVSNLPFLSKVIEKVVARRLFDHLRDLLEPMQSTYKSCHSTETALLKVQNDILIDLDKSKGVFLALLDLSAAFDTVDCEILLNLFEACLQIEGGALSFFRSYLTQRTQCVSVDNVTSELVNLVYVVPQGSVLRPLKFCLYTLPLDAIIHYHGLNFHMYADDTQLYIAFGNSDLLSYLDQLNASILDIRSWMITNKLKINDHKTEFLVITSPYVKLPSPDFQLNVGSCAIDTSSSARNLGVL